MSAEDGIPITMHYRDGEPEKEILRHRLATGECRGFNAFFEKFLDGKASEAIVPLSSKMFLPMNIQYALSMCYSALPHWMLIDIDAQ